MMISASFFVMTEVRAAVRAVGMNPLMRRSKVNVLVCVLASARLQQLREFHVLSKEDGRFGQNSKINSMKPLLVSCIRAEIRVARCVHLHIWAHVSCSWLHSAHFHSCL